MDLVIFTGRVSEKELEEERPSEYQSLASEGRLEEIRADQPPLWLKNFGKIIGFSAVVTGFVLFGLTLLAFLNE
jgi:hypothetical protein